MRIYLDPGHGGDNRGTTVGDTDEAAWLTDFSRALADCLRTVGVSVICSRIGDHPFGLSQRAEVASLCQADLAIVLHVNSHTDASLHGPLLFCMDGLRGACVALSEGSPLKPSYRARYIQLEPGRADGWTQYAANILQPYYDRGVPAVLYELFYASSPRDMHASYGYGRAELIYATADVLARLAL